jgi:hypothetical protein
MKSKIISLLFLTLFFFGNNSLWGQTDPLGAPEPPLFPEYWDLTKKNEDKILKTLPQDIREDLLRVKNIDEEKYFDILSSAPHLYFNFDHDYFLDPFEKKRMEQSQLVGHWEMHTRAIGFLYQHSNQNERPELKTKLQTKLEKLFNLKEEERRLEVKMLEHQLQELKTYFEERKNNKTQIINRRLNELIGKGEYLDW